jgi:hypothetical protein
MTNPPRPDWDPSLAASLYRFTVPEPRASLSDDIVAAALSRVAPVSATPRSATRDRRGGWMRARTAVIGAVALGLMSATAAAAGWFGDGATRLPVISTIAAALPEAVKPAKHTKPQLAKIEKPKAKPAEIRPGTVTPAFTPPPVPDIDIREVERAARKERFTSRVEAELAARDARRAARGLPSNTERERALLEQFRAAQAPAEQKAVIDQVRALRQARRQAWAAERERRMALGLPIGKPVCTPEQLRTPIHPECRAPMIDSLAQKPGRRRCDAIPLDRPLPPRCRPGFRSAGAGAPQPGAKPSASEQPGVPITQ